MRPVVWTIAGSDSGGGAGVQADLKAIQAMGGHGASIITALTAQNTQRVEAVDPVSVAFFQAQWRALEKDLAPHAIKIGMISSPDIASALADQLRRTEAPVVLDPVLVASSGDSLSDRANHILLRERLLRLATVITPNIPEAETLAEMKIRSHEDIKLAARILRSMGPRAVLIKGGHETGNESVDYLFDESGMTEFRAVRLPKEAHGTGCTLASAIATELAHGQTLPNAIVAAKTFVTQALRRSEKLGHGFPILNFSNQAEHQDFPECRPANSDLRRREFARLREPMGFYLIVDTVEKVREAIRWGVKTIQLRKKVASESEIKVAIELARDSQVSLFINDYWEWAIRHGAYGIHLGQSDLLTADLDRIAEAGLRLGISTHDLYELSLAKTIRPSYIAIGTVFPTTLKQMPYPIVGVERLEQWRTYTDVPVVAIGGMSLERATSVLATGVESIAVISDVLQNFDPPARATNWLNTFNKLEVPKHVSSN